MSNHTSAAPINGDGTGNELASNLRQMIAVLQDERQALAALDPQELTTSTLAKEHLCSVLAPVGAGKLTGETRALAETAQRLNEVNRQVRNLLAANVSARLEMLGEARPVYANHASRLR